MAVSVEILNMQGESAGQVDVSDALLGQPDNPQVVRAVVQKGSESGAGTCDLAVEWYRNWADGDGSEALDRQNREGKGGLTTHRRTATYSPRLGLAASTTWSSKSASMANPT